MKKIVLAVFLLGLMLIGPSMATTSTSVAAMRRSEGPIIQGAPFLHYRLDPFIDELWLDIGSHAEGMIHGYAEVPGGNPCYPAPILGLGNDRKMVFFMDFKSDEGCYELAMLIIDMRTLSGDMWRTMDGLTVDGPTPVQLVPIIESQEGSEGMSMTAMRARGEAFEVEPALVGPFTLNPFIDEEWFGQFAPGKINGYADVPMHPSYPAPHLGVVTPNVIVFADDYKPGGYELRLVFLHRPGNAGPSWATVDGITVDGPMNVWLT